MYYAGPAKTPEGYASGSFGPTTAGRMDSYVEQFQAAGGSMVMLAKGNRSKQVTDACAAHGGFYLGSIGGPAARLALDNIKKVDVLEYPELGMEAVWKIEVVDFPAFIVVDDKGNDFFEQVRREAATAVAASTRLPSTAQRRLDGSGLRRRRGAASAASDVDAEEDVGHDAVVLAGQLAGLARGARRAGALGHEHVLQPAARPTTSGNSKRWSPSSASVASAVDERARRPVVGDRRRRRGSRRRAPSRHVVDREGGVPDALPRDRHGVAERGGQLGGVAARRRRVVRACRRRGSARRRRPAAIDRQRVGLGHPLAPPHVRRRR